MKLMERDPYAGVALNSELWFHIVDETDATDDPTGSSFRIDLATLQSMIASAPTLASVLATGNESIGSDIIMSSQDDIFFENNLGTFSTSISNNKTTTANYINYLDTNDGHLITRPVLTSLTQNYLTKANSTGQLIPSLVYDNGSGVAIGTTTITGLFNVSGGMSYFKGSDSTSSNFVGKFDNSSNNAIFYIRNDRRAAVNTSTPLGNFHVVGTSGVNPFVVDTNSLTNVFLVDSNAKISAIPYGNWAFTISPTSNGSISGISAGLGVSAASSTGASTSMVGIYSQVFTSNVIAGTTGMALYGYALGGANMPIAMGVRGLGRQATNYSAGGYFQADDASPTNYGVYGEAQYGTTSNYAGYFWALNTNPSSTATNTHGVRALASNYKNSATVYGAYITAQNVNAATNGVIYGLYVAATTSNGTSTNYAIVTNGGNSGFGTTTPSASAIVEMASTTQGFLPPRMTGAQAEAIATPATGLLVYSTDGSGATITSAGWWGYTGATWNKLN